MLWWRSISPRMTLSSASFRHIIRCRSNRAAHVPVALSTDDEGVARIDLTHEYTRAALEYKLSYADLKQMVRTGLEHTFLPRPEPLAEARRVHSRRACLRQPAARG